MDQAIAQVIPNIGNQEAAVAGNSAAIFTATDRKIIEERSGTIDKNRSFIDLLKERPLTPEVENEETNVKEHEDPKELESRRREHRQILKHSVVYAPREKVEINSKLPDEYQETEPLALEPETPQLSGQEQPKAPEKPAQAEKVSAPKKKKTTKRPPANSVETLGKLYKELSQEQGKLHSLASRMRVLHLKRLFTESEEDFNSLSEELKKEGLASSQPEARPYLEAKLDALTLASARYKLDLLESLHSMDLDDQRKKNIKWLKKILARLGKA